MRISLILALASLTLTPAAQAESQGPKRADVNLVVLHAIGGPECRQGKVSFTPAGRDAAFWKAEFEGYKTLGIHYIVDRTGTVAVSIAEDQIANHAMGHNQSSIGIELVNNGDGKDPYPEPQIRALVQLLKGIRGRWPKVKATDLRTHDELDSRTFECGEETVKRKQDPGANFPLARIRRES